MLSLCCHCCLLMPLRGLRLPAAVKDWRWQCRGGSSGRWRRRPEQLWSSAHLQLAAAGPRDAGGKEQRQNSSSCGGGGGGGGGGDGGGGAIEEVH
jgi:hypothetical protein